MDLEGGWKVESKNILLVIERFTPKHAEFFKKKTQQCLRAEQRLNLQGILFAREDCQNIPTPIFHAIKIVILSRLKSKSVGY